MSDALTVAESSQKHYRAVGLALAASILWSSGGLFIKWVTWNPLAISGARSAIAIVVLLIALRRVQFSWSFAQVGGAVAYTVTVTLFVVATQAHDFGQRHSAAIYCAGLRSLVRRVVPGRARLLARLGDDCGRHWRHDLVLLRPPDTRRNVGQRARYHQRRDLCGPGHFFCARKKMPRPWNPF